MTLAGTIRTGSVYYNTVVLPLTGVLTVYISVVDALLAGDRR
ncbi:hypothetical protein [Phormidium sp. CCY1219]|nr:hypothetical protein [Phormidium sp. CCY1219]